VRGTAAVQAGVPGQATRLIGHLPGPRSDLAAATDEGRTYLVGGYDDRAPLASVLATADGTTFRPAGQLPVAVRYPAVATRGRNIFAFGGETGSVDTDAIQELDTVS